MTKVFKTFESSRSRKKLSRFSIREPQKTINIFLFENKQSYKMTDKITDKMTDGSQNRTNQSDDEVNKECNDSFMSFIVYSFMKNMWSFPIA